MKLFSKLNFITVIFRAKYLYALVMIIAVCLFSFLGFFLYKYIYLTFGISEKIVFLRNEIAPDSINMEEVNKITEYIDKKNTIKKINRLEIKDPFQPLPAAEVPAADVKTATST